MDLDKAMWIYRELTNESEISQQLTRQEIEQAVKALGAEVRRFIRRADIDISDRHASYTSYGVLHE